MGTSRLLIHQFSLRQESLKADH
jgi:hypothetical protein